ncbi:MAG: cyclic nucleotide-binding domain-containing protein [Chloroflexales bacterium]|nr:cyclic nucleotide-binding domain-containing protein [Chloroflexales bacterium]
MSAKSIESTLANHPFFQDIDPEVIGSIVSFARSISFAAGHLIFHQGEPADRLFLISHGSVALEVFAPDHGPILLMTLGVGDVLGWSWLFPPYFWHLDARALTPTKAIAIDGAKLRASCDANHELGYQLMRHSVSTIEQRLQAALRQLVDLHSA